MASIIIIESEAAENRDCLAINDLSARAGSPMALISDKLPKGLARGISFISRGEASVSSCVELAAKRMQDNWMALVNGAASLDAQTIKSISNFPDANDLGAVAYLAASNSDALPELNPENLVSLMSPETTWPCSIIFVRRELLTEMQACKAESFIEMAVNIILCATSKGEKITQISPEIEMAGNSMIEKSARYTLNTNELSRCLTLIANSFNIEDLFPQHPWGEYQEESAAASYHTIAAMFLRFGDIQAAAQCISLSERLEESPRSLALKGLIAMEKGEMLGAVANMVSSLQQYEFRKRDEKKVHYLTFAPRNLEVINVNMSAGLEALNQQDNQRAASHFAQAVFNFDSFYSDNGIDRIEQ